MIMSRRNSLAVSFALALAVGLPACAAAQASAVQASATTALQPRIAAIDNTVRVPLPNSHSPRALAADDAGAVAGDTPLSGITLVFSRTAAQESALQTLLAAQQDPASPLFHQWLTPDQFAARFGLADADLNTVESWLQQQGFTDTTISRSRDRIRFNGTAAQVASAFGTTLHNYRQADGSLRFAPATDLTLPAALAANLLAVTNLSSFRPHSHIVRAPAALQPRFTSSSTGNHFLTPGDIATIYNVTPAYNSGYTGSGQSIAIVGQSFVYAADLANFQTAIGQTLKQPTFVLVPGSGSPAFSSGDESESDLDLEWSSAMAPGASIYFVYTGNSGNYGAFDALAYAVDQDLAPILSSSYGTCETALSSTDYSQLNAVLAQATAQGQTVLAAAGDAGSTDCYGQSGLTTAQQQAVAVDFPASSQYVLAMGGTEFPSADVAAGNNTYFAAQSSTDTVSSALSYIPEQVWNDDLAAGSPASGGGGASVYSPRQSWQAGVAGIPAGSFRLVPDISLDASPLNAPLTLCTSDTTYYNLGQENSCDDGLRDSYSGDLTYLGGTSFDAPIFAGMLAVINQAKGYTSGQGLVQPTLYTLAANSSTYSTAFHDIITGSNACLVASVCISPATTEFAATTGYDEASGLGSINLYNLLTAWPAASSQSALAASTVTLSAATLTPALNAADTLTIHVAAASGNTVPAGSVTLYIDSGDNGYGGTTYGGSSVTLPLTAGTASYNFSTAVSGQHVITAVYTGSGTFATSTATLNLQAGSSFSVSAPSVSVTAGSSVTTSFTVTPVNGYTGTVEYILAGNSPGLLYACAGPANPATSVTGVNPASTTVTIYTSTSACQAAGLSNVVGTGALFRSGVTTFAANRKPTAPASRSPFTVPVTLAAAGLVLFGLRRRAGLLRSAAMLGVLALVSVAGLSGCSSGSSTAVTAPVVGSSNTGTATPGTYTITVSGYDSLNATLTSTTTFTLTIH